VRPAASRAFSHAVLTLYKPPQEVRRLLAMSDACEGAVLACDEYAAVNEDLDQEARLPVGKSKSADRFCALPREALDVPIRRRLRQVHRNLSARSGSNGAPRPLPLLAWIENPERRAGRGVAAAVVFGRDFDVDVVDFAGSVLVFDSSVGKVHLLVEVRQVVLARPRLDFLAATVRPAVALAVASIPLM